MTKSVQNKQKGGPALLTSDDVLHTVGAAPRVDTGRVGRTPGWVGALVDI